MGAFRRHAQACDRARQWASLQLDGELSELERLGLRSHLAGCADCSVAVADMRRIAVELRSLPLEQPLEPIALPRRHAPRLRLLQVGVAAATVAISISLGTLAGTLSSRGNQSGTTASAQPRVLSLAIGAMLQSNREPAHGPRSQIPV